MSSYPRALKRLAGITAVALALVGVLPGSSPAAANPLGTPDINAPESTPISGPNNPHAWSYSFTSRWNASERRVQYLGITMPTSVNGLVNIAEIDTDLSRQGSADTSKNIAAREVFNDGLERSSQASITMRDSRQVLIGTARGELVNINPNSFSTRKIDLPAGTASMIAGLFDAGPEVIISTRSASYAQAGDQGNGKVLGLKYVCTYTQCSDAEHWTRYGAPVPGNAFAYGTSRWGEALISAGGDQRAVLSVYQNGSWSELVSITATATNSRERFTQAQVIGEYLYASYDGSNKDQNGTQVYRLGKDGNGRVTATWVNVTNRWVISPMSATDGYSKSSIIYRGFADSLMIYDPERGIKGTTTRFGDFASAQMPENSKTGSLPTSSCWLVPGKVCSTWRPDGSISLAFKAEGDRPETLKRVPTSSATGETIVNSGRREIGRLAVGSDGSKVYASSSFFGRLFRQIDAATAQTEDLALRSYADPNDSVTQVESIGAVGGQLLMGTYAQGGITQIDPGNPITCENTVDRSPEECNPSLTATDRIIGANQVRPVSIADLGNGQAAIASYGLSGQITGALTLYDTKAKQITNRILLKDASGIALSEMGLASVAGRDLAETGSWIYAGTNARPPNNRSTQTRAAILRYNIYTQEFQAIPAPYGVVNEVKFGADGRLYAMSGFNFVTIEPGLGDKPFSIVNVTAVGKERGFAGSLEPLSDGTFAVMSGATWGRDGELHLVPPRGDGRPATTFLGASASGQRAACHCGQPEGERLTLVLQSRSRHLLPRSAKDRWAAALNTLSLLHRAKDTSAMPCRV